MRIAVTYYDGRILQDFDQTTWFKIYEVAKDQILATAVEEICGYGQGVLTGFLQDQCVNGLICGYIDPEAKAALTIAGIAVYSNMRGDADKTVEDLLAKKF